MRKGGIFGEGAWESVQQAAHGCETLKEGRKEGWGGVWLPTFVGLKSQSSWWNRGGGGD